jgi:outer membrane receptor protein involved in Fe transport
MSALFLLLFAPALFAGVTGKIVGNITNAAGDPLPGVNVQILDQSYGAATDFEGDYRILHVPPGFYDMRVTSLGYRSVLLEQIAVSVDLSTHQDFVLEESAIAGEEITVVAKRPIVQVDQTFSASYVDAMELAAMPVTELSQVVAIQAGVVDGHFRGGRGGEVLYLVDGIPVTDVYDGSRGVDVQVSMVQELQVISGTFNAEYGQAMSGVVNTVTKAAGKKPEITVSGWLGDYLSNHTDEFYGIDDVDATTLSNIELGFSTPTPLPWLSVNGSLRYSDNSGYRQGQRLFSPQESFFFMEGDDATYAVFNREDVWAVASGEMNGDPFHFFWDQAMDSSWSALIDAGAWPMEDAQDSLHVDNFMQWADERSSLLYERSSLDDGDIEAVPMDTEIKRAGQLKLRAQLAPGSTLMALWLANDRSYQDASQSYRFTPDGRLKRYSKSQLLSLKLDHVFDGESFMELSLSHSLSQYHHRLYDDIMDPRYRSGEWNPTESGFYYYDLGGFEILEPDYSENALYIGMANMGGTENEHFSRRTDSYTLKGSLTKQWGKKNLWKTGFELKQHKLQFNQRVVSFSNEEIVEPQGANSNIYTRKPWEMALFVQDKIEFNDVTVNAGVRLDVFDAAATLPADLRDPSAPGTVDATVKSQLSPRLAIAYVVTDTGVLHFSYGHFFQRPSFDDLYRNPDFELTGPFTVVGNPDLNVERTVQYEIGIQQQLSETMGLDVSFYSRDIRDLVSTDRQIETVNVDKYYIYTNRDFGSIKGLVVSLDNHFGGGYSAGLDYTFQLAEANASSADAARNAEEGGREINKYLIPLDWDRRHTLNGSFRYDHSGKWGLSVLGTYGSGLPYTPTPHSDELVVGLLANSGRKPAYINFDLSGYWNVLSNPMMQLSFQAKNLFDRLNENGVYSRTGRAGYDIMWQDLQSEFVVDPGHYSRPREIIVGFRISL